MTPSFKRIFCLTLVVLMCFAMVACTPSDDTATTTTTTADGNGTVATTTTTAESGDVTADGTTTTTQETVATNGVSTTVSAESNTASVTTTSASTGGESGSSVETILKQALGAIPDCSNPMETEDGFRLSEDGKWYIDNGITIGENTVLANAKDCHSVAVNLETCLGDEWKVGAAFRPIKNNTSEELEVCTRMWIKSATGEDCFLFTVSQFQGCISVMLEMWYKTAWLKLSSPSEWTATDSDVFYFELSREKGSDKLHFRVCDKNGEMVSQDTSKIRRTTVLEAVSVAGFGTYGGATEIFYWDIQGKGPLDFQYPVEES